MPIIALAFVLLGMLLLFVLLLPLSLVQRYRVGKARRLARGWMVTTNLVSMLVSVAIFLVGAAVTSVWVPRAFPYALLGMLGGAVLGWLGLLASRWEPTPGGLHYTPNRFLVLAITLVVTARIAYGLWRGWNAWQENPGEQGWIEALGVAGSLAAGGVVIGYYTAYFAGLRRRLSRHRLRFGIR